MRYCKACNTNNWDEANFCAHCGQMLAEKPAPEPKLTSKQASPSKAKKAETTAPKFTEQSTANLNFVASLDYRYSYEPLLLRALTYLGKNHLFIGNNIVSDILVFVAAIAIYLPIWLVCEFLGMNSHRVVAPSDFKFAKMTAPYIDSGFTFVKKGDKYGLAFLLSKPVSLWIPIEYDWIIIEKVGTKTILNCRVGNDSVKYELENNLRKWYPWSIKKL